MRRGLVAWLCAVCAAGCGDDIVPAFRVVAISPADEARDVDLTPEMVIELSEPVDPDTVDGTTVSLQGVEADLAVEGSAIRLMPAAPLPHDTEQRLTVTTGLVSLTGVPLDQPVTSTFTTRWRIWSEPAAIGPASDQIGPSLFRPLVVAAPTGDAVAVWEDDATGAYRLSTA
jgi:hypothetical protein